MTHKAVPLCLKGLGKLKILFKLEASNALNQVCDRNIN